MAKPIGILQFQKKGRLSVGRKGKTITKTDGIYGVGFRKILSELKQPYEYCTTKTINNYDHVLCSLTSYHDVLLVVKNIPIERRSQIHIGGPGCNNINPILEHIDTANFGRCDNGKINNIIHGDEIKSVWCKKTDPGFEGQYFVDGSSASGLAGGEQSFGCPQKCGFCFYSHWNKFVKRKTANRYSSGVGNSEDFFQAIDWMKCQSGGVSAVDGMNQRTRDKINKPISSQDIIDTLLKSNEIQTKTLLRLKLYCIAGFPWETLQDIIEFDFIDIVKKLYKEIKNKIIIRINFSHFIPFQKTPLWRAPFNFTDFRDWCVNNPVLFEGENIKVYSSGRYTPSPSLAAVSTIIQRATKKHAWLLKILSNDNFLKKTSKDKLIFLKDNAGDLLCAQTIDSIQNIITPNKFSVSF